MMRSNHSHLARRGTRCLLMEPLEDRRLLAADLRGWTNHDLQYDVNGDGRLSPFDAVLLANSINRNRKAQGNAVPAVHAGAPGRAPFLDPNGNHLVSEIDFADLVRNLGYKGFGRKLLAGQRAEGEFDNLPPSASPDDAFVMHDTVLTTWYSVLSNDMDPEGQGLTAHLVSEPTRGTLLDFNEEDGSFSYQPEPGFAGVDTFKYAAFDGELFSDDTLVSIVVWNSDPFAADDSYTAVVNTPLMVAPPGVLHNDLDDDGDQLSAILESDPNHGSVTLDSDGTFTYTPHPNYVGADSFSYVVFDLVGFSEPAIVEIDVVQPLVNIDTDSNNTGTVESADDPAADPGFETQAPGNIVAYNVDDDNGNNQNDRLDPAPFRNSSGALVDDDELERALLGLNTQGADLKGFTVQLEYSLNSLRLWSDRQKQALPESYLIGESTVPTTIWVEGWEQGPATIDIVLTNPTGMEIHRDTVMFTVVRANLVAYRPQSEGPGYGNPFARRAIPEHEEHSVGIRRNGDDDDGDQLPDWGVSQVGRAQEDDLIEVGADVQPFPGVWWVLARDASFNINVFNSRTKETGGELGGGWPGPSTTAPVSANWSGWVEWAKPGGASSTLSLRAVDSRNMNTGVSDSVVFKPFNSIVIVLGGEFQEPDDPVLSPGHHGLFDFAIQEYVNGYDVHMYNEDDLWGGGGLWQAGGPAYDEVVAAVNGRGQSQVSIIGYSHGAGSTYGLSWLLNENLNGNLADITGPFTVPFTAYVDGVKDHSSTAEKRRPKLTKFHTNQFQKNSFVHGDRAGGDDDIDRSYLGVDHDDIEDHPDVLDLIRARLYQKVDK